MSVLRHARGSKPRGGGGGPACWGEGQGAAPAKQQGGMTLTADITKNSKKTKWDRGKTVNIKDTNWQEVGVNGMDR